MLSQAVYLFKDAASLLNRVIIKRNYFMTVTSNRARSAGVLFLVATFLFVGLQGVSAAVYSPKSVAPTLSITPSSTPFGGTATLSWNITSPLSRRATCRAEGPANWQGPLRVASGSLTIQSPKTQKYSIVCSDKSRVDANLTVDRNSYTNGVLLYYVQNVPDRMVSDSTSTMLAWSYMRYPINRGQTGTKCTLNNTSVSASGTKKITSSGTYTLECTGRKESIAIKLKEEKKSEPKKEDKSSKDKKESKKEPSGSKK